MSADASFDLNHFQAMTGEDPALQAELAALFKAQAKLWERLLVVDAPAPTWRDAAHTLKGSARGLGLWRLAEACSGVEAAARSGLREGPKVHRALARARKELRAALEALERAIPSS